MIKLIIFDLDGVLVDARELHYRSLNEALGEIDPKYIIQRDEHLSTYDGLPTSKKLEILSIRKGLDEHFHRAIWELKQKETIRIISEEMTYDDRMRGILSTLKSNGYTLCVASNSIRETVKMMLLRKGLMEYFDFFLSNQDVKSPKPSTEIYLQCMIKAGVSPKQTLIIEDSHIGREAALESGANLLGVKDSDDVTYEKISQRLAEINISKAKDNIKWQGGKMNVLIPMAGEGSRFQLAGYAFPKPLIEVNGKPMIQVVVDNLNIDARHIFIVRKEHYDKYNLKYLLNLISPECEIVQVDSLTEGAACTTLLAKQFIDNNEPLLVANSDQFVEWNSNQFMYSMVADDIDAGILTFNSIHSRWSYAKLGEDGFVTEVAEKKPISNNATVGIYYYRKGSDYVKYAEQMIEKNIRVNNEFYVCPVFNEAIADGKRVKIFPIKRMWGIGTPEDLNTYLENYKGEQ